MQNNNIDIEKLKNYINDLEEQITPLTKSRPSGSVDTTKKYISGKKDVKPVKEISEEPVEEEPATSVATPPTRKQSALRMQEPQPVKKKITRTVTEKKKEQLIKAREIRKANTEARNKMKKLESAKLLLQDEITKPNLISSESSSESEPEIVVVKKKKKAKKKIIIKDDDTTEEESDDEEPIQAKSNKSFGKSHRNKKSVVKVHEHPSHTQTRPNYNNFFC